MGEGVTGVAHIDNEATDINKKNSSIYCWEPLNHHNYVSLWLPIFSLASRCGEEVWESSES